MTDKGNVAVAKSGDQTKETTVATWYAANTYADDITEREITRHTDSSVFFMSNGKERREARASDYHRWFQTKREAAQYIVDAFEEKASAQRERATYYDKRAAAAKAKHADVLSAPGQSQENARTE